MVIRLLQKNKRSFFHLKISSSMTRLLLALLVMIASPGFAQRRIDTIINAEFTAGHFSGTVLVAKNGQILSQTHKGYSNLQFAVPMTDTTRLPIASMTKLFTAILTLQLYEKSLLRLDDQVGKFVGGLPADCQNITILQLLTHHSGLKNESAQTYQNPYSTAEFVRRFVAKKDGLPVTVFNYNNIDYILLTRVLEAVSKKTYSDLVQVNILNPIGMARSGVISEDQVVIGLAYGYHNYSFGASTQSTPLKNDLPMYLSNYAGAGSIYSTTRDLFKLIQALKQNKLLTSKTTTLLTSPQLPGFVEYARGYPTFGFYCNDKTFSRPVLERRGSINGFNSALLTDQSFSQVVILLANTDTCDLELIGDKLYAEFK